MPKSPILTFYLDSFKAAAGEGAVLELKLRLLAGKVPTLRKYAHQQNLGNIEDDASRRTFGLREFHTEGMWWSRQGTFQDRGLP
jgi:hypothetical protein